MKEKHKHKSKNQSFSKRFVIIAISLLLLLVLNVSVIFFHASTSCCTEGQTATAVVLTNEAISLQIAETEAQTSIVLTMTVEVP